MSGRPVLFELSRWIIAKEPLVDEANNSDGANRGSSDRHRHRLRHHFQQVPLYLICQLTNPSKCRLGSKTAKVIHTWPGGGNGGSFIVVWSTWIWSIWLNMCRYIPKGPFDTRLSFICASMGLRGKCPLRSCQRL